MTHTPTPWFVVDTGWQPWPDAVEINAGNEVICFTGGLDSERQKANAALIVHAVNSLPALVKALEALTDRDAAYHGNEIRITCESHGDAIRIMREARAALASHKTGG